MIFSQRFCMDYQIELWKLFLFKHTYLMDFKIGTLLCHTMRSITNKYALTRRSRLGVRAKQAAARLVHILVKVTIFKITYLCQCSIESNNKKPQLT